MDRLLATLRARGAVIIHAPSGCMAAYDGTLARARAQAALPAAELLPDGIDSRGHGTASCCCTCAFFHLGPLETLRLRYHPAAGIRRHRRVAIQLRWRAARDRRRHAGGTGPERRGVERPADSHTHDQMWGRVFNSSVRIEFQGSFRNGVANGYPIDQRGDTGQVGDDSPMEHAAWHRALGASGLFSPTDRSDPPPPHTPPPPPHTHTHTHTHNHHFHLHHRLHLHLHTHAPRHNTTRKQFPSSVHAIQMHHTALVSSSCCRGERLAPHASAESSHRSQPRQPDHPPDGGADDRPVRRLHLRRRLRGLGGAAVPRHRQRAARRRAYQRACPRVDGTRTLDQPAAGRFPSACERTFPVLPCYALPCRPDRAGKSTSAAHRSKQRDSRHMQCTRGTLSVADVCSRPAVRATPAQPARKERCTGPPSPPPCFPALTHPLHLIFNVRPYTPLTRPCVSHTIVCTPATGACRVACSSPAHRQVLPTQSRSITSDHPLLRLSSVPPVRLHLHIFSSSLPLTQ